MKFTKQDHGREFTANIEGTQVVGVVTIEDDRVYLCQNEKQGASCNDKQGYEYSWIWSTSLECSNGGNDVRYFRFIEKENEGEELKVQKERVLEAAKSCSAAKDALKMIFPEVFKEESKEELFHFSNYCTIDTFGIGIGKGPYDRSTKDPSIMIGHELARPRDFNKVLLVSDDYEVVVEENYCRFRTAIKLVRKY